MKEAFDLAGSPRAREANRKRILRDLRSARHEAQLAVKNIDRLLRFFEGDLTTAWTKRPGTLRDALCGAIKYGATSPVGRLLGVKSCEIPEGTSFREYLINCVMFGGTTPGSNATEATCVSTPTAEVPLDEIDWTHNARTEEEAALRAEVIREIESEHTGFGTGAACFVKHDLRNIVPSGARSIGTDLDQAILKWTAINDEEESARKGAQQRDLLARARANVERSEIEAAAARLPGNVVLFRGRSEKVGVS